VGSYPIGRPGPVQDRRGPPMRQPPRAQRQVRVHGLADHRVEEVEWPCRREDLRRRQPVGGQLRGRRLQARQLGGPPDLGL